MNTDVLKNFPNVEGHKDFPGDISARLLAELHKYKTSERPYWIQIMGIPGSGKTRLVQMLRKSLSRHSLYTLAAFDEYMELIPEYKSEQDRVKAFAKYEAPARAMGFEVFKDLIERKVSVLFEHSTTFPAVRDLMYFIKQSGYTFVLIRVVTDTHIAKKRVKNREKRTKRHIPESVIDERVIITADRWNELSKISDAQFAVMNNGDLKPRETFSKTVIDVVDFINSIA